MVGRTLGHYRVEAQLGAGGMGEVYLARDNRLGRRVALKFLPGELTDRVEWVQRLKQEARAASALNHPNIVTVHQIGRAGGRDFIASEFIEGETLRQRLEGGPLPLHEALDIAMQVAVQLAAAHEAGIVHRDIKPENIMIRRDGYVKVVEFWCGDIHGSGGWKRGCPHRDRRRGRSKGNTALHVTGATVRSSCRCPHRYFQRRRCHLRDGCRPSPV